MSVRIYCWICCIIELEKSGLIMPHAILFYTFLTKQGLIMLFEPLLQYIDKNIENHDQQRLQSEQLSSRNAFSQGSKQNRLLARMNYKHVKGSFPRSSTTFVLGDLPFTVNKPVLYIYHPAGVCYIGKVVLQQPNMMLVPARPGGQLIGLARSQPSYLPGASRA